MSVLVILWIIVFIYFKILVITKPTVLIWEKIVPGYNRHVILCFKY